jgi:hypothetical protein
MQSVDRRFEPDMGLQQASGHALVDRFFSGSRVAGSLLARHRFGLPAAERWPSEQRARNSGGVRAERAETVSGPYRAPDEAQRGAGCTAVSAVFLLRRFSTRSRNVRTLRPAFDISRLDWRREVPADLQSLVL